MITKEQKAILLERVLKLANEEANLREIKMRLQGLDFDDEEPYQSKRKLELLGRSLDRTGESLEEARRNFYQYLHEITDENT